MWDGAPDAPVERAFEDARQRLGAVVVRVAVDMYMRRWQDRMVLEFALSNNEEVGQVRKRSRTLILGVDAPLHQRWSRAQALCADAGKEGLEAFAVRDAEQYAIVHQCLEAADEVVLNLGDFDALAEHIEHFCATSAVRLRPDWDLYFMRLAFLAASRSNCMKRRVGAILTKDKKVLSTGYNGTPRRLTNCLDGGCTRCNNIASAGERLDQCLCLHAEENAIMEAGSERCKDCCLYSTSAPCLACTKRIIQVGVAEVVFSQSYATDERCAALFAQAGVTVRRLDAQVVAARWLEPHETLPLRLPSESVGDASVGEE